MQFIDDEAEESDREEYEERTLELVPGTLSYKDPKGRALPHKETERTSTTSDKRTTGRQSRSRKWVVTINNPPFHDEELSKRLSSSKAFKWVFQREVGGHGTEHIQLFLYLENARTLQQIKKLLGSECHAEKARGSDWENYLYCTKSETRKEGHEPISHGDFPVFDKPPNKIFAQVREKLKSNTPFRDIILGANTLQEIRYAYLINPLLGEVRQWKTHVSYFWGPSGTGKTKTAWTEAQDEYGLRNIYYDTGTGDWWDGYMGQPAVIIDEFRGDFCKFHRLLQLLDRYPLQLPIKGGFTSWIPRKLWITSIYRPQDLYPNVLTEPMEQLLRRIDRTVHFSGLFNKSQS